MTKRDSKIGYVVSDKVKDEVSSISRRTGLSESEIARRGLVRELKELQQLCNKAEA